MSIITSGNHSFVLNEATTLIAINEFMQPPTKMPLLFNQKPSSMAQEQSASISGLSQFQEKPSTGTMVDDSTTQQFERTWTHREYAKVVRFERRYVDDQRFGHFETMGQQIGFAAARTYEKHAASVFNNAFTSQLCEDGLTLCNTAHLNASGGNSQGNYGSASLSYDAYRAAVLAHQQLTDYNGDVISITPDRLLVPLALQEVAWQIARSTGQPGSANNDLNMFQGTNVIVWEHLTSASAWFSIDSRMQNMANFWFWRIGLELAGTKDFETHVMSISGYMRMAYGPQDFRWIYGSKP